MILLADPGVKYGPHTSFPSFLFSMPPSLTCFLTDSKPLMIMISKNLVQLPGIRFLKMYFYNIIYSTSLLSWNSVWHTSRFQASSYPLTNFTLPCLASVRFLVSDPSDKAKLLGANSLGQFAISAVQGRQMSDMVVGIPANI